MAGYSDTQHSDDNERRGLSSGKEGVRRRTYGDTQMEIWKRQQPKLLADGLLTAGHASNPVDLVQAQNSQAEAPSFDASRFEGPKMESTRNYWDAIKSVSRKDLAQLVDWVRQNSVESFSGKNLLEPAKKTMDLVRRNGRSLSGKDFLRLMVISLALAGGVEGVKVRGKDGCVAESNVVFDKQPLAYNNTRRMVMACFNERIGDMLLRYVEDPCDSRYRELQLTFIDSDFERSFPDALELTLTSPPDKRMFLHPNEQRHKDTGETLRGTFYHGLTHWLQEFAEVPKDASRSLHRENHLIAELRAEYSIAVYGSDQDIAGWRWPPDFERPHEKPPQADSLDLLNQLESSVSNPLHTGHASNSLDSFVLVQGQDCQAESSPFDTCPASEPTLHYSDNSGYGHGGLFWAWLDEKFPGFVDNVTHLARRKPIGLKDCEQFTNGQSLDTLWEKYKTCDSAEIKSILEAQRKKYVSNHEQLLQKKDEL